MAKSSSGYWEERIATNTWKIYNSLEEKNRELLNFYTDASKAVREELYTLAEKYSKDGELSLSDMYKGNRLKNLGRTYEETAKQLGQDVQELFSDNLDQATKSVDTYIGKALGDETQSALSNKKMMEKLLNEPWRGDSFSSRLWKKQKKLAVGLNDILLTGLQQGKTVTEVAVKLHNYIGNCFNDCHRLVRTETMHYLNSATLQRYKDSGVKYVQVWAASDERTCDICGVGGYHGKVHPIDKCPVLPFHANCRCTIIPCFDQQLIRECLRDEMSGKMNLSIPDDVYKKSGMTRDIKRAINSAIKKIESEYNVYLDLIEGGGLQAGDIFLTGGFMEDGVLKHSIVFNYNIDYERVEMRMERLYNSGVMAGKSYEDYIAHEIAHIIPYQNCINEADYFEQREKLRGAFVSGISGYADNSKDGAESLAEAFVRYRNGEKIPPKAHELIKKYIIPWRR